MTFYTAGKVGDPDFVVTRTIKFTRITETTWKFDLNMAVGLPVQITAHVPVVGSSTESASLNVVTTITEGTNGIKKAEETEDSVTVELAVPPKSKMGAYVKEGTQKLEVPWTATAITTYKDGSQSVDTMRGTYVHSEVIKLHNSCCLLIYKQ